MQCYLLCDDREQPVIADIMQGYSLYDEQPLIADTMQSYCMMIENNR